MERKRERESKQKSLGCGSIRAEGERERGGKEGQQNSIVSKETFLSFSAVFYSQADLAEPSAWILDALSSMRSALLKVLLLPLCCFGSSDCLHNHHVTAVFFHNPSQVWGSFSCGWNINKKTFFQKVSRLFELNGTFKFLALFLLRILLQIKEWKAFILLFLCRRDRGFRLGGWGQQLCCGVLWVCVPKTDAAGGSCCRMRQGWCVCDSALQYCSSAAAVQLYDLLVPCPSVRMGPGAGRCTWHNTAHISCLLVFVL